MKKISIFVILILGILSLSACSLFGAKEEQEPAPLSETEPIVASKKSAQLLTVDDEGSTRVDSTVLEGFIAKNQKTTLSENEILGIKFMLEEEKLARDVYAKFFEKWSQPIFDNISSSEHTHISAVRALADKYGVDSSFYNNKLGEFSNPHLKELYSTLILKGSTSTLEALKVGAEIEEIDIMDLEKYLGETDNSDIKLVYENLQKASRNHLRSFVKNILRREGVYVAQKLSEDEFDSIVSSANEQGNK